jgi:hypothetical protein
VLIMCKYYTIYTTRELWVLVSAVGPGTILPKIPRDNRMGFLVCVLFSYTSGCFCCLVLPKSWMDKSKRWKMPGQHSLPP